MIQLVSMSEPLIFTDNFIENRYKDFSFEIFKKQAMNSYWLHTFLNKDENRFNIQREEEDSVSVDMKNKDSNVSKICSIL